MFLRRLLIFAATSSLLAFVEPARTVVASGRQASAPFEDRAVELGIDFVHFNGMSGELYLPEMMGPGAALVDYDGDGDLDAYLVQGTMLGPGKELEDAVFAPRGPLPPRDRLFRNELDSRAGGAETSFTDVTEPSRIRAFGYGMGVAAADYDNDGWVDLYITNLGSNQMLRNNGDGTFDDVTARAGVDDPRLSTSASFFDFDGDGWLDLYVANYVDFDLVANPTCYATSSRRDYCGPGAFEPQPDSLWRNNGNGTFEEVTFQVLANYLPGPGLGVIAADFNDDDLPDMYVANDGSPNQLWLNQGDGTFVDDALFAGVALNRDGLSEASMGVDAGDFDRDGDEDLFMTHLMGETNTLYVNAGAGLFADRTVEAGLAVASLPYTSFGMAWFDYDNDSWLDLLILNGSVRILEELHDAGDPLPLDQRNQLFHNLGGGVFEEITDAAGPAFDLAAVSRGAAFGDVDNDGDTDVLVANNAGPARLLINTAGNRNPWFGLRLVGRGINRDAVGVTVAALRADGSEIVRRRVRADGSYLSASDVRLLIGLGDEPQVAALRAILPGGKTEEWKAPELRRYEVRTVGNR